MRLRLVLALGSVASAALLPRAAGAHHVVTEHGIASIMPQTVASLDFYAVTFDAGGRKGRWEALTPSFEWHAFGPLSLFASLPIAHVRPDGGDSASGIGDLSLSAKVSFFETPHGGLLASAGLGVELPTGDKDDGLGSGHVGLAPFLGASSAFLSLGNVDLVAYGLTSLRASLGEGGHHHADAANAHAHPQGSVLAPHAEREVYGRAMLAAVFASVYLAGGAEGTAVLQGQGQGHVGARGEIGWKTTEALRLFLGADALVAGERRYGVRGRAGVAWMF